jgi:ubiquitin carboxyl-terminal hydrolase 14
MNATVQALRAIPELQIALNACAPPPTDIASSLRDLFASMDRVMNKKGTVAPTDLLQRLRVAVSQFVVTDTGGTQDPQQGKSVHFTIHCLTCLS